MLGWTSKDEQFSEGFKHVGGVELPVDDNDQAFTGMLFPGVSASLIALSLNSAVNVRRFSIFHLALIVEA